MTALAKRYARAAVSLVDEHGGAAALDELVAALRTFKATLDASAELKDLVANPALRAQRDEVLATITKEIGLSESARRLVLLLTAHDRLAFFDDVLKEVEDAVDARFGRLRARVRSAIPLSALQEQRLGRALEKRFGRPVAMNLEIDPTILGGLVCQVGDLTLDSSLRRHLEVMRERLLS